TAEHILPMQGQLGNIENPREIIQWAFEAEEGSVSEKIIEIENKNIVARLTQKIPKGIPALESIKEQIKPEVIKQLKAKIIIEKFDTVKGDQLNLNTIAQKLGTSVKSVENVVFSNPIIPGIAQEPRIIGTVFGMQPTGTEAPLKGEQG